MHILAIIIFLIIAIILRNHVGDDDDGPSNINTLLLFSALNKKDHD